MTRTRKAPQETLLTRPARITRQSRGSRSLDRTSRTPQINSASPFPHLRSLSPFNTGVKVEAGSERHDPLMISVEDHKAKAEGRSETPTAMVSDEVKEEELKAASVETDDIKMAQLRLASVGQADRASDSPHAIDGNVLPSIESLLRAGSERRNSEVYQEFLESYGVIARMAAALCSYWSPDVWFLKQENPSPDQHRHLEAFCAEFLDCITVMQSSLDRLCHFRHADNALVQAIRRFLRHLFRVSSNVLNKARNGIESAEGSHLKAQVALVDDLVHLLGDVVERMIMAAKKDMAFPHQLDTNLRIESAIAVPPRLQGLEFPQTLLLPQFVTGNLIVSNADFL